MRIIFFIIVIVFGDIIGLYTVWKNVVLGGMKNGSKRKYFSYWYWYLEY